MALFSFYNMRKPRQFDHKPIYWDPHKEALEVQMAFHSGRLSLRLRLN